MHHILNSLLLCSKRTLVKVAICTVQDGGFQRESMCSQMKPAHIPHNMVMEVKVQAPPFHTQVHESAWRSMRGQANQEWRVTSLMSLSRGFNMKFMKFMSAMFLRNVLIP